MSFIKCFIAFIAFSSVSGHLAYGSETEEIIPKDDFTHIFIPALTETELSTQERNLAQQVKQQERMWKEGTLSRYQYFTTVGDWYMVQFALSRQKTPEQGVSEEQRELAKQIIANFHIRIDTLARLAAAGQGEEEDVLKQKLNLLVFERDMAIAEGKPKDTIIRKQQDIVQQASAWLAFVQKAVEHHVMGLSDLQNPRQTLEKAQNRLKNIENSNLQK